MVHLFAQIAKALAFKNKQRYKNYSQAKHIHQALQHHRAYSFIYRYVFVAGQHTTTAYFAQAWKKQVQEIHHHYTEESIEEARFVTQRIQQQTPAFVPEVIAHQTKYWRNSHPQVIGALNIIYYMLLVCRAHLPYKPINQAYTQAKRNTQLNNVSEVFFHCVVINYRLPNKQLQ